MFTNRHEIRRIDLLKSEYTQVVPTLKNAVALDVDVSTNKMFWCDLYHRKIYRYRSYRSDLTFQRGRRPVCYVSFRLLLHLLVCH